MKAVLVSRLRLVASIFAAALAGCSGGGFLPFDAGPHTMDPAVLAAIVRTQSHAHRVPPSLVHAVITQESDGDPSAISPAGAMGLMQLMPATARAYGAVNPFDPQQNVAAGTAYLHDLLVRYHGNLTLALAAYNAGSVAVARYHGIPPYAETRGYVEHVTQLYRGAAHTP